MLNRFDILCFSMARLVDSDRATSMLIDWDELAGNFDGIAVSDAGDQRTLDIEKDIKATYDKIVKMI